MIFFWQVLDKDMISSILEGSNSGGNSGSRGRGYIEESKVGSSITQLCYSLHGPQTGSQICKLYMNPCKIHELLTANETSECNRWIPFYALPCVFLHVKVFFTLFSKLSLNQEKLNNNLGEEHWLWNRDGKISSYGLGTINWYNIVNNNTPREARVP